jgi:acetyl-CoA acetyltransferase
MPVTRAILDRKSGEVIGKEEAIADNDECNRPDTALEGLLALKPHLGPNSGEGTVTAGNSSQLSDGASATLEVPPARRSARYSLQSGFPRLSDCRVRTRRNGHRSGLRCSEASQTRRRADDLWELNEAFAVQVVYCRDRLGIDPERFNVNGGPISIGHLFGMTGSRLVGTLANEMARSKARFGVVTM